MGAFLLVKKTLIWVDIGDSSDGVGRIKPATKLSI